MNNRATASGEPLAIQKSNALKVEKSIVLTLSDGASTLRTTSVSYGPGAGPAPAVGVRG